ncbi:MAG: hypothetical protein JSR97_09795 [Verrucomicrobia bacterium]|nr:hypothetical protein [Verrucomicrobiota bacterium]
MKDALLQNDEFDELKAFNRQLTGIESISYHLQGKCNLEEARVFMDYVIEEFGEIEGVEDKISSTGSLVHSPRIEAAVIKVLKKQWTDLNRRDKEDLKRFETKKPSQSQSQSSPTRAEEILAQFSSSGPSSNSNEEKYKILSHIPASSAMVERLFSRAKIIFEPHRRNMTPFHLEMLLYLKLNPSLWDWESLRG